MRSCRLIWIDATEAILVDHGDGPGHVTRIASAVPAHHRSTGHIRHDPAIRHGGGGAQDAGERHRQELLERFVERVLALLPNDEDVLVLGPGTVRERLVGRIRERDAAHRVDRHVETAAAARLTDRQLVARLRRHVGDEARRRGIGHAHPAGAPLHT